MKAVHYLLRNATGVTALLQAPTKVGTTGADAIYIGHTPQDQEAPYITMESSIIDNNVVKEQARSLVKEQYEVFVYGRSYASVKAIAEQVELELDNKIKGTYNGQELTSCKLVSEDVNNTVIQNHEFWLLEQVFEAVVDVGLGKTPITNAVYSNNDQSISSGVTMTSMAITLTPGAGTATYSVVSGSLPTNATLNASTGAITQSSAASADVYAWTVKVSGYGDYYGELFVQCNLFVGYDAIVLTQAAYDALGSYSSNTYYLIDG